MKKALWKTTRTLRNGQVRNFTFDKKAQATEFVKASAIMNATCTVPAKLKVR